MVTHWESSKKPLYVRTVWKEGQHHVILNCKENTVKCKSSTLTHSIHAVRTVKSAPSTNTNLNVSTVKLLNNVEPLSDRRCKNRKVRIKLTPKSSGKIVTAQLSLNVEVEKSMKSIPLGLKSQSVELIDQKENLHENCMNLKNFGVESEDDSLTDRVLMWLDLAMQNGNYPKPININPPLEAFHTEPIARKRHIFTKQRCFSSYQNSDYQFSKYTFQVAGVTQNLQTAYSSKNDLKALDENDDAVDDKNQEELVSSRLEENVIPENIFISERPCRKFGVKRQLHIFLPNLEKKTTGFNDSELNKQFNSCSLLENSREI